MLTFIILDNTLNRITFNERLISTQKINQNKTGEPQLILRKKNKRTTFRSNKKVKI